jgi:hypothetical protein
MKAKKARKRLLRVEDLLATVIKKYSTKQRDVQELLDTAKTAVADVLTNLPRSANGKKPPAQAAKARQETKRSAAKAAGAGQQMSKAG